MTPSRGTLLLAAALACSWVASSLESAEPIRPHAPVDAPTARPAPAPASPPDARPPNEVAPAASSAALPKRPAAHDADLATQMAARSERARATWTARRADRAPTRLWVDNAVRSGALQLREAERFEVAGVEHVPIQAQKEGLPVFNRRGRLHRRDGAQRGVTGRLATPLPEPGARWNLDAASAVAIARRAADVRAERATPIARRGWLARPGGSAPVWRVTLASAVPLATPQVTLHAGTGALLDVVDLLRHVEGTGSVYEQNGVVSPTPVDRTLWELDGSGRLSGRVARIFDERDLEAFRPDHVFRFPSDDPRFAQTNVYRVLTNVAGFAEHRGFPRFLASLPAFVNLGSGGGEFNNAFYDPMFRVFGFGNGDGFVTSNLGTDGDVAAHEMGHHLFQTLVDPELTSSSFGIVAMSEGTADAFAALAFGDPRIGESTIPGQPFLRDLGPLRGLIDVESEDPHEFGLIYGSALWDLVEQSGVDVVARIVIAGLPFLPPDPELPSDYRDALQSGDDVAFGGAHRGAIQAAFDARGFDLFDAYETLETVSTTEPRSGNVGGGSVALYYFHAFPGSQRLEFRLSGSGDADLFVGPASLFDIDVPGTYFVSESYSSSELVVVTPSTQPSVHADDLWVVFVVDYPNDAWSSSYTLSVVETLPTPTLYAGAPPQTGSIDEVGEVDLLTFAGVAGQVVRLEASALAPTLDPAVAIFDPAGDTLARDDDDGPGLDSLIQGVRLPRTGTFGIAVFSPAADVDPTIGTGGYSLTMTQCFGSRPDTDQDGLTDVCDDDDDADDFDDPVDEFPLDPLRCVDWDEDLCDDCSGGAWNFFADGPDVEGDGYCDAGDEDDDNDGCVDAADASPLSASPDDDLDFLGDHCDNCPAVANPDQADCNANGAGDACDATPCPEPAGALGAAVALVALGRFRRRAAGAP